jgi:hypothetical protein
MLMIPKMMWKSTSIRLRLPMNNPIANESRRSYGTETGGRAPQEEPAQEPVAGEKKQSVKER